MLFHFWFYIFVSIYSYLMCCYVEDEDPAIATLAAHFTNVINQISDGKWYHLPSKWTSKKDQTTVRVIDITYFENDRVLDSTPEPFFSSSSSSW